MGVTETGQALPPIGPTYKKKFCHQGRHWYLMSYLKVPKIYILNFRKKNTLKLLNVINYNL